MKAMRATGGFTLIEVVIALSIVAALLAIVTGGLRVGVAAWRQGDARADVLQRDRSVRQVVARALAGAHPYRADATNAAADRVTFDGTPTRVTFVTSTPPLPAPVPIAFTAVELEGSAGGLVVRQRVLPAREPLDPVVVLTDPTVRAMHLRYQRPSDVAWQDSWDGAQEKSLPGAIEIVLVTDEVGRRVEHAPLVVPFRALMP